ncbi:hypothetical protein IID04_02655 [PVC group bacterium]|nr:hypothetical protein [PVC group bacterium]
MRIFYKFIIVIFFLSAFSLCMTECEASRKTDTFKKKKKQAPSQVHLNMMSKHGPSWWYRYHYKNWKASHEDLIFRIDGNLPVRRRNFNNTLQSLYGMQMFLPDTYGQNLQEQIDRLEHLERDVLKAIMKTTQIGKVTPRLEKVYRAVHRDFSYTEFNDGIFVMPEAYRQMIEEERSFGDLNE